MDLMAIYPPLVFHQSGKDAVFQLSVPCFPTVDELLGLFWRLPTEISRFTNVIAEIINSMVLLRALRVGDKFCVSSAHRHALLLPFSPEELIVWCPGLFSCKVRN